MLFFALVEAHDGLRDLAHQVAAVVGRFQIQLQGQLAQQIQGGSRGPMQVQDLVQAGVQPGGKAAGGGGLAGADFAGQQAGGVVINQELKRGLDLLPGWRSEQLFRVGAVTEGSFLKTKKGFPHRGYSLSLLILILTYPYPYLSLSLLILILTYPYPYLSLSLLILILTYPYPYPHAGAAAVRRS